MVSVPLVASICHNHVQRSESFSIHWPSNELSAIYLNRFCARCRIVFLFVHVSCQRHSSVSKFIPPPLLCLLSWPVASLVGCFSEAIISPSSQSIQTDPQATTLKPHSCPLRAECGQTWSIATSRRKGIWPLSNPLLLLLLCCWAQLLGYVNRSLVSNYIISGKIKLDQQPTQVSPSPRMESLICGILTL